MKKIEKRDVVLQMDCENIKEIIHKQDVPMTKKINISTIDKKQ